MKMTIPTAVPAPTASISSTVTVDCGSSSCAEMAANHGQTNESGSGSFSSSSSIPSSTAMAHPPPTLPHVPSLLHNNTLHQPADGQQQQQRPRRRWWPATMEDDNRHWQLPMPYRPVTFSSSSRMFLTAVVLLCLLCCPHYISCRQKRSAPSAAGAVATNNEMMLPEECYHRYADTDHHLSLLHWLHRKNASHYSPISPSYQQALLKLQAQELAHGLQVTSGASSCNTRKMKVISASTPLRERALCQFEYVLNYNPQRIPSTFTEVKCSCPKPSVRMVGNRMFECEPLRYQVRVLLFDPQCSTYVEHTETIALACLPVLQANTNAEGGDSDDETMVPVPAEAPSFMPTR